MRKRIICSVIRLLSITTTLTVLRLMHKIGIVGYVMVCFTAIMWSLAAHIEESK